MGDVLYLSLRSMSLDEELRFCSHRPLVGDASGWAIKGLGGQLVSESTECLAPAEKPLLWSQDHYPHEGVKSKEWGHSLRSVSFLDEHTKKVLEAHPPFEHKQVLFRSYDDVSRALATANPVKQAALALYAGT